MTTTILQKCPLFKNLDDKDLKEALAFFHAEVKQYKRGAFLHRAGTPMVKFGLLLSGSVHVYMDDFDGNQMLMASVVPGITFGESLCYLEEVPQVYIECMSDCTVLVMDTYNLKHLPKMPTPLETSLLQRFTAMLAQRTLSLNDRIQILSKLTIREKVITLLSQQAVQAGSDHFTLPFSREAMAVYLGVNQNALSRVLSEMQKDGIISFKGNDFKILLQ